MRNAINFRSPIPTPRSELAPQARVNANAESDLQIVAQDRELHVAIDG